MYIARNLTRRNFRRGHGGLIEANWKSIDRICGMRTIAAPAAITPALRRITDYRSMQMRGVQYFTADWSGINKRVGRDFGPFSFSSVPRRGKTVICLYVFNVLRRVRLFNWKRASPLHSQKVRLECLEMPFVKKKFSLFSTVTVYMIFFCFTIIRKYCFYYLYIFATKLVITYYIHQIFIKSDFN